ncbi:MAG: hypothetical protein ABII00_11460 [Elusimicrobiota bacterium]
MSRQTPVGPFRTPLLCAAVWLLPAGLAAQARAGEADRLQAEIREEGIAHLQAEIEGLARFRDDVLRAHAGALELDERLMGQVRKFKEDLASIRSRLAGAADGSRTACGRIVELRTEMEALAATAAEREEGVRWAERAAAAAVEGGACAGPDLLRIEAFLRDSGPVLASIEGSLDEARDSHREAASLAERVETIAEPWKESGDILQWLATERAALGKLLELTREKSAGVETSRRGFSDKKEALDARVESASRRHQRTSPATFADFKPRYEKLGRDLAAVSVQTPERTRDYAALEGDLSEELEGVLGVLGSLGCELPAGTTSYLSAVERAHDGAAVALRSLEGSRAACARSAARSIDEEVADEARVAAAVLLREREYESVRLRDLERDLKEWEVIHAAERRAVEVQRRTAETMRRRRRARVVDKRRRAPESDAGTRGEETAAPPAAGASAGRLPDSGAPARDVGGRDPGEAGEAWVVWGFKELMWEPLRIRVTPEAVYGEAEAELKDLLTKSRFDSGDAALAWICPGLSEIKNRPLIGYSGRYRDDIVVLERGVQCRQ